MRILEFPSSSVFGGLGDLYVQKACKCTDKDWHFLAYAWGSVQIPENVDIRLILRPHTMITMEFDLKIDGEDYKRANEKYIRSLYDALDHLGPNDIQSLVLRSPIYADELAHVGHLRGLKELVFWGSVDQGWGNVKQRIDQLPDLEKLTNLENLTVRYSPITDNAFASIAKMKSIKSLRVFVAKITGEGLDLLQDLQINDLAVTGRRLSRKAFERLACLRSLRRLEWHGPVSDVGFADLAELPSLTELSLLGAPVSDTDIQRIGALTTLQSLSLAHTNITDHGLRHLEPMVQLRKLSLSRTSITDDGICSLTNLSKLSELNISYTRIGNKAVSLVSENCPNLRKLNIDFTNVNDEARNSLAKLTHLEELSIHPSVTATMMYRPVNLADYTSETAVTDKGYTCLKTMTHIRKLNLEEAPITDLTLEYIKKHPNLEVLQIRNTVITDKGMESVATCSKLKELYAHNTAITDAGILLLTNLRDLRVLDISGTKVGYSGIARMRDIPSLRELGAFGIDLTDDELIAISGMHNLCNLCISWSNFSPAGLDALARNQSLRTIIISDPPEIIDPVWELQKAMPWCLISPLPPV